MSTVDYIRQVIGERNRVQWLLHSPEPSPSEEGRPVATDPVEIFVETADGALTWGWSISGLTPEAALSLSGDSIRRFRHPDGWVFLVDAEDPEFLWIEPDRSIHVVRHGHGFEAAVTATGAIPEWGAAKVLSSAGAVPGSGYRLLPGISEKRVSDTLRAWTLVYLGEETEFSGSIATGAQIEQMASLAAESAEGAVAPDPAGIPEVVFEELAGALEEIDDLLFEETGWFQLEMFWPGEGGGACFPGSVRVHCRDEAGDLAWLADVVPLEVAFESFQPEELGRIDHPEGWSMLVAPADPAVLHVPFDRTVYSVVRDFDGYEAYGFGTGHGRVPTTDQWDRLREALRRPRTALVVSGGWSDERVSEALEAWVESGTDYELSFFYDEADPSSDTGERRNQQLSEVEEPPPPAVDRRRTPTCMYRPAAELPYEDPLPCPRQAAFMFEPEKGAAGMVFVCDAHVPDDRPVTAVMPGR